LDGSGHADTSAAGCSSLRQKWPSAISTAGGDPARRRGPGVAVDRPPAASTTSTTVAGQVLTLATGARPESTQCGEDTDLPQDEAAPRGAGGETADMANEPLVRALRDLHAALTQHPTLDDEDRTLLHGALSEVQRALDHDTSPGPDLVQRLENAALGFEDRHPALTRLVERLAAVLRQAGV
jgi:hypothetical protein